LFFVGEVKKGKIQNPASVLGAAIKKKPATLGGPQSRAQAPTAGAFGRQGCGIDINLQTESVDEPGKRDGWVG